MKDLFIGMVLVFLDVNIGLGEHTFDVLPDFVGFFLMMRNLEVLSSQSRWFRKARPVALAMAVYAAVLYAVDALAVTVHGRFVSFCLGILALIASLLIGYWIVSGVRELERKANRNLEGEKLHSFWLYMAVIQTITYACAWIPLVGTMGMIAALVMNICFLVAFYRTMDLYEGKK